MQGYFRKPRAFATSAPFTFSERTLPLLDFDPSFVVAVPGAGRKRLRSRAIPPNWAKRSARVKGGEIARMVVGSAIDGSFRGPGCLVRVSCPVRWLESVGCTFFERPQNGRTGVGSVSTSAKRLCKSNRPPPMFLSPAIGRRLAQKNYFC